MSNAIIHRFIKIQSSDKYKEVTHYERICKDETSRYIKDFANISVQRHFNNSQNVAFWYKSASRKEDGRRDAWSKRPVTGLFRTNHPRIYYGDVSTNQGGYFRRHTFLFFVFSYDMKEMAIVECRGFYPPDVELFLRVQIPKIKKYFGIE